MGQAHSKVGASSAYRWFECPGSVQLSQKLPKPPNSVYAQEGIAAHKLAEKCLLEGRTPDYYFGEVIELSDGSAFEVDDDMVDAVSVYVDLINGDYHALSQPKTLLVEEPFHLDWLHKDLFGTNDACIIQPFGTLTVYDHKHGKGVPVEIEANKQLMYYAVGAAAKYDFQFEKVEIVVVQPRAPHKDGPIRRWSLSAEKLQKWAEEELLPAVEATEAKNPKFKAGEHCRFCPANKICPELEKYVLATAKAVFNKKEEKIELPAPEDLDPKDLKRVLDAAGLLDSWIAAVKAYAHQRALQGEVVEGYKLVAGRGSRNWISEDKVEKAFKEELGDELYTEPKLLSVAQLEKKLGSKRKKELEEYWSKSEGKPVLAPEADRRQAITNQPPSLVFKKIEK